MTLTIYQVDAFTDTAFSGNPAAVCLLDQPRPDEWMQAMAAEMNLSETAFLLEEPDGYALRWFTPTTEVPLCGHATLASAHVLYENNLLADNAEARFHTQSGVLTARRLAGWIEMDLPADPPAPAERPVGLEEALGTSLVHFEMGASYGVAEASSPDALRLCTPDMTHLLSVTPDCIALTSRSDSDGFDYLLRFFAPAAGIPEDPVTGSAHCALTPYWAKRLGRAEMTAYQASRRGGVTRVALAGDVVRVSGQAVTVIRGELSA